MTEARGPSALALIARGYLRALRGIGWVVVFAAGAVGVAALIVFPLWYASTRATAAYSLGVLVLAAAAIVAAIVRRAIVRPRRPAAQRSAAFRRFILRAAIVVVALGALYLVLAAFALGWYAAAIPLAVIVFAALGYVSFVARRPSSNRRV